MEHGTITQPTDQVSQINKKETELAMQDENDQIPQTLRNQFTIHYVIDMVSFVQ